MKALFSKHFLSTNSKAILSKEQKRSLADFMELTKFKLSSLNAAGSYTMFYYHAPLAGVGLLETSMFIFATQTVAMAT